MNKPLIFLLAFVLAAPFPALAGSRKGHGQGVSASSSSSATGNGSANASVNYARQAPGFGLGGLSDGDCLGQSGQFVVSTPFGGGGVGASTEDVECTKRRTARLLFDLGMINEARAVAQNLREYRALFEGHRTSTPFSDPQDRGCLLNPALAESMGADCH